MAIPPLLLPLLREHVERHGLGEVVVAPFEVELREDSAVQPDVLVVLADRQRQLTSARLLGPPSLAVEVVSYSSKRTDRLQKRRLYQEEGVPEYWIVDVDARHVERWTPRAAAAEVFTERLAWHPDPAAPALEVDLVAVFARVWR